MLLKIGNIVFVDSCQFLATSLDNLVKALRKLGVHKFANTIRHFGGDDDPYFEKGCYPYEYMTDETKLDETELPPKSAFYNRRRAVRAREAAVDEARHEDAVRLASFLSLTRRATSRRRIRSLHTRTRLSTLSQPAQHDVLARVEGDRRRVGVDNRSGHLSHDRICHSWRVKLRRAASRSATPSPTFRRCPTIVSTCRRRTCSTSTATLCKRPVRRIRYWSADSAF